MDHNVKFLFLSQGWLGNVKMKAPIGFDKVVMVLHQVGAPKDVGYFNDDDQLS